MDHIAIDLGGKDSQICVRGPDGKILEERKYPTAKLERFLKGREPSRVIVETCAEAFAVAEVAKLCGHDVRVVAATLVRSLGIGARGIKTDRRDAQVLSEVSSRVELPSVHVPSDRSQQLRSQCGVRDGLVSARTQLINQVRGWTRTQMIQLPSGETSTFPKRTRETLIETAQGIPEYIERLLVVIDTLNQQIALADQELKQLAKEDEVCQRLMTVPGIGPLTSLRFTAALDVVGNFPTAHTVESFIGLTPGEKSSSQHKQRTGITKAGPSAVRRLLVQSSWNIRRLCPNDPICLWAKDIELRRGKFVATVAVARKLAGILFAMWRDGSTYQPQHSTRRLALQQNQSSAQ